MLRSIKLNKLILVFIASSLCDFGLCYGKENAAKAKISEFTTVAASTVPTLKLTAANAMTVADPKDGLNKRNTKFNNFASSKVASVKSYDPPPEFYRGPGSTVSTSRPTSSSYTSNDNEAASFSVKPFTFPENRGKYEKWPGYGTTQDRISIGHYGSSGHNSAAHGGSSYPHNDGISSGYGYGYESKYPPYDDGYHNDYRGNAAQYPVGHGHGHGSSGDGYYIGSNSAESPGGIPFDVYGTKGHYAGAGGEYSYSSYPDIHEPAIHKGHGVDWQQKALLAKSFLIPLASAAVLGIAAAFVSNPLLLQLGTVSVPPVIGKRRKRRDLATAKGLSKRTQSLSASALAYRPHRQRRLARS